MMIKLPKLRETVTIKFSSLRNGLGPNLGVIFDIDTIVERKAYRKRNGDGWKWQIKEYNKIIKYDHHVETDQEILDEIGQDDEVEIVR
jgi:chloramphenicol 3-O-phosphotransferase